MGSQCRLLVRCRPVSFDQGVTLYLRGLAIAVNVVLNTEECVAGALEDTADLEGPGNGGGCSEEPVKLHSVTNNPASDNRQSEPLARFGSQVGEDLGDRKGRFNGETDRSDGTGVNVVEAGNMRQEQFENDEADDKVHDAMPKSASPLDRSHASESSKYSRLGRAPLPEIIGALR